MRLIELRLVGAGFRTAPAAVREALRFQRKQTAANHTEIELCAP
jgi:hypothetical protein